MRKGILLLSALLLSAAAVRSGDGATLSLAEADRRLGVAFRMIEGGVYDRAADIAAGVLDAPEARFREERDEEADAWLLRREAARFALDRSRLGLASTRAEFQDAAAALSQLANNRYRLADPVYNVQAAYWAARANEEIGEYAEAVRLYSRVGGLSLPAGMEGEAAFRTSRCLRRLAEGLPYPGDQGVRQRRDQLLNQAIVELERARLAFPMGDRRRELELELIALRLARRETQFIRDAATEAGAFIEKDATRDYLRARAALYRGQAASLLGNPGEAVAWFQRVVSDENPDAGDARQAELGLALSLMEMAESANPEARRDYLAKAAAAVDRALAAPDEEENRAGIRVVKARLLLDLNQPASALEALAPALAGPSVHYPAWRMAGAAELSRGRLAESLRYLHPVTRPSNPDQGLSQAAGRDAAEAAKARRDFGLALAMNHRISRTLRRERRFSLLLASEFRAMEMVLALGRMSGPVSLSSDNNLLSGDTPDALARIDQRRGDSLDYFAAALGRTLSGGGNPDRAYDLAIGAEAADGWTGDGVEKLELAIAMIRHLRQRRPPGVDDGLLASRQGEARYALALAKAERLLSGEEPSLEGIADALSDFAAAAADFREASSGGFSVRDSLDQGMVGLESGNFLIRLAERWDRGPWSSESLAWRGEAERRIEASLAPFNQAVASAPPSSLAARRAKWLRGRALELRSEWRRAAADYLSLMNNSELPRALRVNAARRWAVCMGEMGDGRQALPRLSAFADSDAETALIAGKLAEASDNPREARRRYLYAADPAAPSFPPSTPGRAQEAAYLAARLMLEKPAEADPLGETSALLDSARALLEKSAALDLRSAWAAPMLELLCANLTDSGPEGWRAARRAATAAMENPDATPELLRAMYIASARALAAGGDYPRALEELDLAGELIGKGKPSPRDSARITLETARIFRRQGRRDDAVRAYAETFASHPREEEAEEARMEAAETLMRDRPDPGAREKEQARGILSGLRDQMLAERLMRGYGIR